jgi:hypothetical protein
MDKDQFKQQQNNAFKLLPDPLNLLRRRKKAPEEVAVVDGKELRYATLQMRMYASIIDCVILLFILISRKYKNFCLKLKKNLRC